MGTRVEIYKDGLWQILMLADNGAIKYNAVINKIGKLSTREIGHTNTFSLPNVHQNRKILGLNSFNSRELSSAMNTKHVSKYYVEDKVIQSGFLVINNTNGGTINVNFIDESLDLVQKWGSITFKDLVKNNLIELPADYATAISELRNYPMPINAALDNLDEVGTRGYNFCHFPNNLNAIGDKFQKDSGDRRIDNKFNQYQSRPVFNVKGLFDLAIEAYGYTAEYINQSAWGRLSKTFINNKSEGSKETALETIKHQTTTWSGYMYKFFKSGKGYRGSTMFTFPTGSSLKPNDVENFVTPSGLLPYNTSEPWLKKNTIFVPRIGNGNSGTFHFTADWSGDEVGVYKIYIVYGIWKNSTPGGDTISNEIFASEFDSWADPYLSAGSLDVEVEFVLDKTFLDIIPSGADPDGFIGFMVRYDQRYQGTPRFDLENMSVEEILLPIGGSGFDDYGQYLATSVDLSDSIPNKSLKTLISNIMHKEGILMDINSKTKVVKFFDYGNYEVQKNNGIYYNWSDFLIKGDTPIVDTDYGKEYAIKNKIGLSEPYLGNTIDLYLENRGLESKYKDFTENYVKEFKDVISVTEVQNTNYPYTEYEHLDLGLVEYTGQIINDSNTPFTVRRRLPSDGTEATITGTVDRLPKMENVNYATLPDGVALWYKLVDEAVKVKAKFLIPVDVIKNLDISKPVYVEGLNGFYIIEEVSEYVNSQTPTVVKLIKLIHDLRGAIEVVGDGSAQISISAESFIGTIRTDDTIVTTVSFYNYTPTGTVAVIYEKVDNEGDLPNNTIAPIAQPLNPTSPYLNNLNELKNSSPSALTSGWYRIQARDAYNLVDSNYAYGYFETAGTPPPVPSPSVYWGINPFDGIGLDPGEANITFNYLDFVSSITSSVLEYQQVDEITGLPISGTTSHTVSFPIGTNVGTQTVDFVDGIGWYLITLTVNGTVVSATQPAVEV